MEHFEGNTAQPFQYNGRDGVMHDINGLYYMRARYYHSELKRFLNRDVIRGDITEGQTFNRYAYVNGDPVRYVDPLGLARLECEVFEEARIPRSGEEWNEYFKEQYGDGNVAWGTTSIEKLTRDDARQLAQNLLKNGEISLSNLESMVPSGATNTFIKTSSITDGAKYEFSLADGDRKSVV